MKKDELGLIKLFGARMKKARELCNLTQSQAAKLLGYENSSYLSKIESGTYDVEIKSFIKNIKLELVINAAKIYEVSTDYLLGLSDEWERDAVVAQEKHIEGWIIQQWQISRAGELNLLRKLGCKITAIESSLIEIEPAAKNCHQSLLNFSRLNPEFEDMKAGASLQKSIIEIYQKAVKAKSSLSRYHEDMGQIGKNLPLLDFVSVR